MGARHLSAGPSGLPATFEQRFREVAGAGADDALAALGAPRRPHLRVNPLKATADASDGPLADLGAQRVPWCAEGWWVQDDRREDLVNHPAVRDGRLYPQSPSSWLPVLALDPQPGEEVLDLASAPGGKALHIAARMQNVGRLACVEPIRERFFRLQANLSRAGVRIASTYLKDGRGVGGAVPARFDRVLLDAPCSSEAMLRAGDAETWRHWSERKVHEAAHKQRGLILSAFDALKPGGVLVYATCSSAPEEDEAVLDHLLQARPEAAVEVWDPPAEVPRAPALSGFRGTVFPPSVSGAVRVLPDRDFDVFFLARVRKG